MIHDSFFDSLDIADLTIEQRYLILGMIAHADDQGRLLADPRWLKKEIFPYDSVRPADVQEDLEAISNNGDTVLLYEAAGRQYVQLANWWEYQNLQWAKPSVHPAPEGWEDRIRQLQYEPERWVLTKKWPGTPDRLAYEKGDASGNTLPNPTPDEVGDSSPTSYDLNTNTKESKTPRSPAPAREGARPGPGIGEVYTVYENEIGSLTQIASDRVGDATEEFGCQWVIDAIGIAVDNNVRKWSYVDGILQRWRADGRYSSKASKDGTEQQPVYQPNELGEY